MTEYTNQELTTVIDRIAKLLGMEDEPDSVKAVQAWLAEPTVYVDDELKKELTASVQLSQQYIDTSSKTLSLDGVRFVRVFANRILMKYGNKEGMYAAFRARADETLAQNCLETGRDRVWVAGFSGVCLTGYALINARTPEEASSLLNNKLTELGLTELTTKEDMTEFENKQKHVYIIWDGDY